LGLEVGVEIEAGDVVISTISQAVQNWVDNAGVTEEAGLDGIEDSAQSTSEVSSLSFVELLSNSANSGNILSEDEHVLLSDFLGNLDVGTVHGSDNETTVHDEFHVGGS